MTQIENSIFENHKRRESSRAKDLSRSLDHFKLTIFVYFGRIVASLPESIWNISYFSFQWPKNGFGLSGGIRVKIVGPISRGEYDTQTAKNKQSACEMVVQPPE